MLWDLQFVKEMALLMLIGVALGVAMGLFFIRSSFKNRTRLIDRESRLAEAVWAVAVSLALLWPLGVLLIPSVFYHSPALDGQLEGAAQFFGVFLWMIGGGTIVWSARELGKSFSPRIEVREKSKLITSGPYSRMRHPIYFGIIVAAMGQTIAFLSLPLLLLSILIFILARYRARKEEALLRSPDAFGDEYSDYASRTGSLFPRLR